MGAYVNALLPVSKGGAQKYAEFAMSEDFPADATAGGFRPGACNELACHMPAEIAVHVTGHDLRHLSSLWDYVDALRTLAMPDALVLASFPALL